MLISITVEVEVNLEDTIVLLGQADITNKHQC